MRIKEFRVKQNMIQSELAKKASIKQQRLSHWEVGRREMSVKNAKKLAEILKVKNWWELYE